MGLPGLVLIHGAAHTAECWTPVLDHLHRLAPELAVLAVDLPCRRGKPGDFATATLGGWADSVVSDVDAAGLSDVVLVGHSLGGLVVPGVMARLGSRRVREAVLAAAAVPPDGMSVSDSLLGALGPTARRRLVKESGEIPRTVARFGLTNGMSRAQRRRAMELLVPEAVPIVTEKVSRRDMPPEIPRSWIMTLRDRLCPVRTQHRCIAALGGVQRTIYVDTCHMLMLSEPEWLAGVLLDRCRLRA